MAEHTTWVRPPSIDQQKLASLYRIEDLLETLIKEIQAQAPKVRKVRKGYQ